MGCTINWPLVLEFTKALAGPLATVAVAFIVAVQARKTFIRQKSIEKRLGWYESMHVSMDKLSKTYFALTASAAGVDTALTPEALATQLDNLQREFAGQADLAWLYAGRGGFHAVQRLQAIVADFHTKALATSPTGQEFAALVSKIQEHSKLLSIDLRDQMAMEPLRLSPRLHANVKELRSLREKN